MAVKVEYNRLAEIAKHLDDGIGKAVEQSALEMTLITRKRSRVRTHKMQRLWFYVMTGKRSAIVATNNWYTFFHEFGTRKMKATPMIRPAVAEIYPRLVERLKAVIK